MGIYIYLAVSKSVTQQEWEKVYKETVNLVEKLPLAELRNVEIHGSDTLCVVPTKERNMFYGNEKTKGWKTSGDRESLGIAESFYLCKNLVHIELVNLDAGDAILGAIPKSLEEDNNDSKFKQVYHLWGSKTQGEDYHIYLLAVAALLENRLKEKIFAYGDVTKGQFRAAVEIANEYLEYPIEIPDSCDIERFCERVRKLPVKEVEKIEVIEEFYLGNKDTEYGEYLRNFFEMKHLKEYWRRKFAASKLGTLGFARQFQEYINLGFKFEDLFELVDVNEGDKKKNYEKFIDIILDSRLYLKEKNTSDRLTIDVEEERPYSVATLFAQGIFGAARNTKVSKYMPLERVQEVLEKHFGEEIDVKEQIKKHLEKEKESDISEQFAELMEKEREKLIKEREEYDIADYDLLRFYEKGDTILSEIETSIQKSREFLETLLEEEDYLKLVKQDINKQFCWLSKQNRYYCIRHEDWEKIYKNLHKSDGLARYYSLFRIQLSSQNLQEMALALLLNDDLWAFSGKLVKIKENGNKNQK